MFCVLVTCYGTAGFACGGSCPTLPPPLDHVTHIVTHITSTKIMSIFIGIVCICFASLTCEDEAHDMIFVTYIFYDVMMLCGWCIVVV